MSKAPTHTPAEVIARLIIEGRLGEDPLEQDVEWPTYVARLPESTARAMAVYDGLGFVDGRDLGTGEIFAWDGLTIRSRDEPENYSLAYRKLFAVGEFLSKITNRYIKIDAAKYSVQNIRVESHPAFVGNDPDTRRPNFTINALAYLREI